MLRAVCGRLLIECRASFPPSEPIPSCKPEEGDRDDQGAAASVPAGSTAGAPKLTRGSELIIRGAQQGELAMVRLGLEASDVVLDSKDGSEFCTTALHWAAQGGHLQIISALLDANASVNATNAFRQTALQVATFEGHPKVVEALLNAKADPHHEDVVLGSSLDIVRHERPRSHKRMLRLLTEAARPQVQGPSASGSGTGEDAAGKHTDSAQSSPL